MSQRMDLFSPYHRQLGIQMDVGVIDSFHVYYRHTGKFMSESLSSLNVKM